MLESSSLHPHIHLCTSLDNIKMIYSIGCSYTIKSLILRKCLLLCDTFWSTTHNPVTLSVCHVCFSPQKFLTHSRLIAWCSSYSFFVRRRILRSLLSIQYISSLRLLSLLAAHRITQLTAPIFVFPRSFCTFKAHPIMQLTLSCVRRRITRSFSMQCISSFWLFCLFAAFIRLTLPLARHFQTIHNIFNTSNILNLITRTCCTYPHHMQIESQTMMLTYYSNDICISENIAL